jgi:membrane protein implicated in regulation of membrane protease activity
MSGGQIAALLLAILLLLPGGCFVFFGIVFLNGLGLSEHPQSDKFDPTLLLIGFGILAVVALLFWVAFRRRPSDTSGPPQTPENTET